tara:strand:- start:176 stop:352 length:177 start_codon:yes stop_codon:yes gene_type:complete
MLQTQQMTHTQQSNHVVTQSQHCNLDAEDAAIAIGASLPSLQQSGCMLTLQQFTLARC